MLRYVGGEVFRRDVEEEILAAEHTHPSRRAKESFDSFSGSAREFDAGRSGPTPPHVRRDRAGPERFRGKNARGRPAYVRRVASLCNRFLSLFSIAAPCL